MFLDGISEVMIESPVKCDVRTHRRGEIMRTYLCSCVAENRTHSDAVLDTEGRSKKKEKKKGRRRMNALHPLPHDPRRSEIVRDHRDRGVAHCWGEATRYSVASDTSASKMRVFQGQNRSLRVGGRSSFRRQDLHIHRTGGDLYLEEDHMCVNAYRTRLPRIGHDHRCPGRLDPYHLGCCVKGRKSFRLGGNLGGVGRSHQRLGVERRRAVERGAHPVNKQQASGEQARVWHYRSLQTTCRGWEARFVTATISTDLTAGTVQLCWRSVAFSRYLSSLFMVAVFLHHDAAILHKVVTLRRVYL